MSKFKNFIKYKTYSSVSKNSVTEFFLFLTCRCCPLLLLLLMSIPATQVVGFPHLLPLFRTIVCRLVRMASLTPGIWFSIVILAGIPAAIKDAVHLLLWWRFAIVVSFFILFIKGCEENLPVTIGFLNDGCVWNLFLPWEISWGQLSLTETQGLVN